MMMEPGVRVRVLNQPDDPYTGILIGVLDHHFEPEGGGDLVTRRWLVRRDGGGESSAPEAAIRVVPR